jgi:hypothetical protein
MTARYGPSVRSIAGCWSTTHPTEGQAIVLNSSEGREDRTPYRMWCGRLSVASVGSRVEINGRRITMRLFSPVRQFDGSQEAVMCIFPESEQSSFKQWKWKWKWREVNQPRADTDTDPNGGWSRTSSSLLHSTHHLPSSLLNPRPKTHSRPASQTHLDPVCPVIQYTTCAPTGVCKLCSHPRPSVGLVTSIACGSPVEAEQRVGDSAEEHSCRQLAMRLKRPYLDLDLDLSLPRS